jgi:mannose-6-phosphate isomerase-like protein (cupin superfamily)
MSAFTKGNDDGAPASDAAIQVVKRDTIPPIRPADGGHGDRRFGELRDFRRSDPLRAFLPTPSRFSVSWVALEPGETLHVLVHPIQSLVIFYAGSGEMTGDVRRAVAADDVVVVPAGCRHGFASGPEGLFAISLALGERPYALPVPGAEANAPEDDGLDALDGYAKIRASSFGQSPLFHLLDDGTLEEPHKLRAFADHLDIWVEGTRAILIARQTGCRDPAFEAWFARDLGALLRAEERADARTRRYLPAGRRPDAVLSAITDWFAHQMLVLDNTEKLVIVHWVLAKAGARYAAAAARSSERKVRDQRLWPASVANGRHAFDPLRGLSLKTRERLLDVAREAWDMMDALSARLAEVVRAA